MLISQLNLARCVSWNGFSCHSPVVLGTCRGASGEMGRLRPTRASCATTRGPTRTCRASRYPPSRYDADASGCFKVALALAATVCGYPCRYLAAIVATRPLWMKESSRHIIAIAQHRDTLTRCATDAAVRHTTPQCCGSSTDTQHKVRHRQLRAEQSVTRPYCITRL